MDGNKIYGPGKSRIDKEVEEMDEVHRLRKENEELKEKVKNDY